MRWDNLTIAEDEGARLPGYRDPATVRRFDAPEALDVRFYEIHAKSAINRVPAASKMPFRWTINPYRGCTHACTYCASGETPILMADGRCRPLRELRVGDEIYGTERRGRDRRYVRTTVLDHWSTVKPAHRVTLEDGTELIASADHRFLTERGWTFVRPALRSEQRPYLTTANALLGTGGFVDGPQQSDDYERGYLCGIVRGDGTLASHACDRPGRTLPDTAHRFRLALCDEEALDRADRYLFAHDVYTTRFAFHAGSDRTRPAQAIRTQARSQCERVGELIRWPQNPSDEWRKGFLAGIFDAEGSGGGVIRVSDGDATILRWTAACLDALGVRSVLEPAAADGVRTIRLRGGLRERLRFFHLVDPAIRRKLDIDGMALKSDARTAVVSIAPLETMRLYDITTSTGDFIANGVVSHNCFARPTHTYLDFDAGRDFEREIVVKVNVPEVVRAELARPSWRGEHVAMVFCPDGTCPYLTRTRGRSRDPGGFLALASCGGAAALVPSGGLAELASCGACANSSSFRAACPTGRSSTRISRTEVRDLFTRNKKAREIDRALGALVDAGRLERAAPSDGPGRPAEKWIPRRAA